MWRGRGSKSPTKRRCGSRTAAATSHSREARSSTPSIAPAPLGRWVTLLPSLSRCLILSSLAFPDVPILRFGSNFMVYGFPLQGFLAVVVVAFFSSAPLDVEWLIVGGEISWHAKSMSSRF